MLVHENHVPPHGVQRRLIDHDSRIDERGDRGKLCRGPSAEKLSTIASLVDPRIVVDKPALDAMWRNMILMDEHTWDSANSVDDPDTSETKEQITVKDSFAVGAQASVDALLRS